MKENARAYFQNPASTRLSTRRSMLSGSAGKKSIPVSSSKRSTLSE